MWRGGAPIGIAVQEVLAERSDHLNYVLRCVGCRGMDGGGDPGAGIPDFRITIGAFALDDEGRNVPGGQGAELWHQSRYGDRCRRTDRRRPCSRIPR
jgi:hypothetical protein